ARRILRQESDHRRDHRGREDLRQGQVAAQRPSRAHGPLQRPSLAQVAASAPTSSSSPSRPANIGSTPMPRTTLASRILSPIQSSPRKVSPERSAAILGNTTLPEASARRRASPPV